MFLLDTNVVSELRRGEHCNAGVYDWYVGVQYTDLFTSALVIGEIRKGIARLRLRRDYRQSDILEVWLEIARNFFAGRILPIDAEIANAWGEMYAIRNVPIVDGLLAATAKVHDLTLVTRNLSHVQDLGADLLNPFTSR